MRGRAERGVMVWRPCSRPPNGVRCAAAEPRNDHRAAWRGEATLRPRLSRGALLVGTFMRGRPVPDKVPQTSHLRLFRQILTFYAFTFYLKHCLRISKSTGNHIYLSSKILGVSRILLILSIYKKSNLKDTIEVIQMRARL